MSEHHTPIVRPRSEHCISRRDIDPDALKVLYRLARGGYTAYLVGGGVRDLLLGRKPKDFDVGTDAHPRQIKDLFRNCFLIGRRFRLAHVKFGDKVIETCTFRRAPEAAEPAEPGAETSLLQTEDNTFGTPEQDALRRDFTVNGLFYDIESFSVIDFVGGLADLEARRIRCIGDPDIRFREDPVRMIRAVRFAGRLGFTIEPATYDAILRHRHEIGKCAVPRLFEELQRLFPFGAAQGAFRLMRQSGLMEAMLPALHAFLERGPECEAALDAHLAALDRGDTVLPAPTPALWFSTLFLPVCLHAAEKAPAEQREAAYLRAMHELTEAIGKRFAFPRRLLDEVRRTLSAQTRLNGLSGRRRRRSPRHRFARQDVFGTALALQEIHCTATGKDLAALKDWRDLYEETLVGRPDPHLCIGPDAARRPADAHPRHPGHDQTEADENLPEDGPDDLSTGEMATEPQTAGMDGARNGAPSPDAPRRKRRRRGGRGRRRNPQEGGPESRESQLPNHAAHPPQHRPPQHQSPQHRPQQPSRPPEARAPRGSDSSGPVMPPVPTDRPISSTAVYLMAPAPAAATTPPPPVAPLVAPPAAPAAPAVETSPEPEAAGPAQEKKPRGRRRTSGAKKAGQPEKTEKPAKPEKAEATPAPSRRAKAEPPSGSRTMPEDSPSWLDEI